MGRKELPPELVGFGQERWEVKEDWPHGDLHVGQVMDYTLFLAERLGLNSEEKEMLTQMAGFHDVGYKLVQEGTLRPDEHYLGSSFLASFLVNKSTVVAGILFHTEDILPENVPLCVRILRDADRIAGMGWTGIIREAYYLGFRHVYFTIAPEEVENFLLYDFRLPPFPKDFEASPKYFCLNHVGPYLVENGFQDRMSRTCDVLLERFSGKRGEDGEWLVEPVMPIAQKLFKPKADAIVEFKNWLNSKA